MLARLPFTIAAELDAGAIDGQGHGTAGAAVRDLHDKPCLASAELGIIRGRPVQPRHLDQAGN